MAEEQEELLDEVEIDDESAAKKKSPVKMIVILLVVLGLLGGGGYFAYMKYMQPEQTPEAVGAGARPDHREGGPVRRVRKGLRGLCGRRSQF